MDHNKGMDDGALFVMDGIAASHDGMAPSGRKNSVKRIMTILISQSSRSKFWLVLDSIYQKPLLF